MPILELHNLTWSPPDGDTDRQAPPLFENASLQIAAGELVSLQGPSGSGKSTLLRCLVGLEPRHSGVIRWRGEEVGAHNIRAFRQRVHYVQQEPVAVEETVAGNLEFARRMAEELRRDADPKPLDQDAQQKLLDDLGLGAIDWERDFDRLSVGERQRVALVRSLTPQPDVLLLDEPTASLDDTRARQVEDLLTEYKRARPERRALVWVTHSPAQRQRLGGREIDIRRVNRRS